MTKKRKWTCPGPSKYKLGEQVETIEELNKIAGNNKAVYITILRRHMPAAVLLHMQCITVLTWISRGNIITIK